MEADVRWCPHCNLRGEKKRQRLLQINDSSAVLLCENEKCVNLEEMSPISSLILQRKSSEIPNTKRKKCRSVPVTGSAPKMTNTSSHLKVPSCTPFTNGDNTDILARVSESPHTLSNESEILLRAAVSLKTMPQVVFWRNKSALCWLDACMCVVVSCRSLRECLVKFPETSILRTLCLEFVGAQKRPMVDNAETFQDVNARCRSDINANGDSAQLVLEQTDGLFDEPCPVGHPIGGLLDTAMQPGTSRKVNSAISMESRIEGTCNAALPVESFKENSGNQEVGGSNGCLMIAQNQEEQEHCTKSCRTERSSDHLDKVRAELFQRLLPVLKCDVGQEESPVIALPILFRLDGSLEEHFMCRYRWEFYCTACGHTQINLNKKAMPTFTSVPVDFNVTDPVMLQNCPRCGSHNQRSHLIFHSLPACVMMHFQDGLQDSDLARHRSFIFREDTYTLSAVVQYRRNPNHFVTLIKDQEANQWLEYDDILPSPFSWQPQPPSIPASEIHILVWERLATPCTACERMRNEMTAVFDTPGISPGGCISGGNGIAASQPNTASHWTENVIRRSNRFAALSVFHKETKENSVSEKKHAEYISSTKAIDKNGRVAGATCNKTEEHGRILVLTTETECGTDLAADPHTGDENELRAESIIGSNANGDGKSEGASGLSAGRIFAPFRGFKQDEATEKANGSEQGYHSRLTVTVKKIKMPQQSKKLKPQQSTKEKPVPKPQHAEPTFVSKATSRRKRKNDNDQSSVGKTNTTSILGKIPEQLLNYSRFGMTSCSSMGSMPSQREGAPTNVSVLNKMPKQLLSGTGGQPTSLPPTQVEPKGKVVRPILVGSTCRVPVKRVKFQPYSNSLEHQHQKSHEESKEHLSISLKSRNNSTLSSWQKRVGIYSMGGTIPRKRLRRDSADDTGSYVDPVKHVGHPCSSVSSPSACSDISSLSDNQSFASGKGDLAATMDDLCKMLDIDGEYTPSMSSRYSSPSQDMFLSELLADEAMWTGLEDKVGDDRSLEDGTRQQTPLVPCDDHTLVTMTTASMEMPVTCSMQSVQSSLLAQVGRYNTDILPSVESFQPAGTPLSLQIPIGCNELPEAPANISTCVPLLVGTLPSVGQAFQALEPIHCTASPVEAAQPVMIQSTMSPSCVPMLPTVGPVAMQPDLKKPNPCTTAHVTSLNDHMLGANTIDSLSGGTAGASEMTSLCTRGNEPNTEVVNDVDDITDPRLFYDIQDNLDVMENDWNETFLDLSQ